MTAADHAKAVAMDIAGALLPAGDADGGGARVQHVADAPTETTDPMETAVSMNDHQGHTWAEIVGASNLVDKRIAVGGRNQGREGCIVRRHGAQCGYAHWWYSADR